MIEKSFPALGRKRSYSNEKEFQYVLSRSFEYFGIEMMVGYFHLVNLNVSGGQKETATLGDGSK